MPEPRRRAARRSLMAGLIRYDRIQTTEARANAIRGEVEKLIDAAVKARKAARAHLASVVSDEDKATQILEFARHGRFSLSKTIESNEERAEQAKAPLTDKGRRFLEDKLKARREELLAIISDEEEAEKALEAAYEAMVIELHARRLILRTHSLMSWLSKRCLKNWLPVMKAALVAIPVSRNSGAAKATPAEIAQIALV